MECMHVPCYVLQIVRNKNPKKDCVVYWTCMKGKYHLVVVDEEGELFLSEESCLPHVHAVLPIEELDY